MGIPVSKAFGRDDEYEDHGPEKQATHKEGGSMIAQRIGHFQGHLGS